MNREPINPDDPDLTAYALGEMPLSERREFESKLESSPNAQKELESMDDIMSLLSKGLKNEWSVEMKEPNLEALPTIAVQNDDKIVPFTFGRSKKAIGSVAAVAAAVALVAVSLSSFQSIPSGATIADGDSVEDRLLVASLGHSPISVPTVEIDNEISIVGGMTLSDAIENLETLAAPVDASYLDARPAVPESDPSVGGSQGGIIPASFTGSSEERVDSYLPPVRTGDEPTTGLIEQRLNGSQGVARIPVGDSTNVVVRGFVSLDDVSRSLGSQAGEILRGFQPVSVSNGANSSSENDLRLMAELQAVQQEILLVVRQMPETSSERTALLQLLERNRSAIEGLRSQLSQ